MRIFLNEWAHLTSFYSFWDGGEPLIVFHGKSLTNFSSLEIRTNSRIHLIYGFQWLLKTLSNLILPSSSDQFDLEIRAEDAVLRNFFCKIWGFEMTELLIEWTLNTLNSIQKLENRNEYLRSYVDKLFAERWPISMMHENEWQWLWMWGYSFFWAFCLKCIHSISHIKYEIVEQFSHGWMYDVRWFRT